MAGDSPEAALGAKLKALRQERGLSLGALSRLSGVHDATLSRWENNKRQPLIPELELVLNCLEVGDAVRRDFLLLLDAPRALVRLRAMGAAAAPPVGGDLLQTLRLRKGWTQEQAAQAVGVPRVQVVRWEHGDVWPSDETLHYLCWHLGATSDEIADLSTAGKSGQLHYNKAHADEEPDLPREGNDNGRDDILPWAHYVAQHLRVPPQHFVINIFRLEHRLSVLAPHHLLAEQLLPNAYAVQARHHLQHLERRQAKDAAQRGLALARRQRLPASFTANSEPSLWFGNVIVLASLAAESNSPAGLRNAVQILTKWLPMVQQCMAHYAWGSVDLALYLARLGRANEAVTLSAAVCERAACTVSGEYDYRLQDHAHVLCQAGRSREALLILGKSRSRSEVSEGVSSSFWIRQALLEAQGLLLLEDQRGADERFHTAEQIAQKNRTDSQFLGFLKTTTRIFGNHA